MTKEKLNRKAMTEAYVILMHLDEEELNKIPINILDTFKNLGDRSYIVDFESLVDRNMMKETKDILCYIYYTFLADDEDKKMIDNYLNEANKIKEKTKVIENTQDNIKTYTDVKIINEQEENLTKIEELPAVVNQSNLFIKIWTNIKKLFNNK